MTNTVTPVKQLQSTYENLYKDQITKVSQHVGMHNPYIVNIGKWHKVTTNGEPRVTLRVHANPRTMTFDKIEELHKGAENAIH